MNEKTHCTSLTTRLADNVRDKVRGEVLEPTDPDFDATRSGFQLLAPHRPAVVVSPADAEDVRTTVDLAASAGLRVAVQATGHGLTRPLAGNGVLIDTTRLTGVRVSPETRTAWIEAGATWRDVIDAASGHGLAPLSGSLPGVGAVSYTLGGGVGLLARRYGYAADHVRRIDLVTADGRSRRVTAESDPELFWALRGAGSNFGIVTGMEIELVPVTRLYGGCLYFDLSAAPELAHAWCRWTADLPDELTSALTMLSFPDVPGVAEPLRGRHVGQVQIAFLGSPEHGDELLEPLRELGPRLRDTVRQLPYSESGAVFDEPDRPSAYRGESLFVEGLDERGLDELTRLSGPDSPAMCVAGLRHLGGALAREPNVPNAVAHRQAAYTVGVLSPVDPANQETVRELHRDVVSRWSPRALGHCLNFTFAPLDEDTVTAAYPSTTATRLRALRAEHDPSGLFHTSFPLPPGD